MFKTTPLTIVTETWKIVQYTDFCFLAMQPEEDEQGNVRYAIVGVMDIEEGTALIICTAETEEEIIEKFETIVFALEAGKSLVSFVTEQIEPLDILRNARQKPGSESN